MGKKSDLSPDCQKFVKKLLAFLAHLTRKFDEKRILHRCFLPSLAPFGQAVSEEKIFLTLVNQKQELP
jgi:hypothetical protein